MHHSNELIYGGVVGREAGAAAAAVLASVLCNEQQEPPVALVDVRVDLFVC